MNQIFKTFIELREKDFASNDPVATSEMANASNEMIKAINLKEFTEITV